MSEAGQHLLDRDPESEIVKSKFEIVGTIPNLGDLATFEHYRRGITEITVELGIDQEIELKEAGLYLGNKLNEEEQESLFGLWLPSILLADADQRAKHGTSRTRMRLKVSQKEVTALPSGYEKSSNRRPHTDAIEEFYLASIGGSTAYFAFDFTRNPDSDFDATCSSYQKQIDQMEIEPTVPADGSIVFCDDETVHKSPEDSLIGKKRILAKFYPEHVLGN